MYGSCQASNVNMPPLISSSCTLLKSCNLWSLTNRQ
jgi:hypothetical protein